MTRPGKTEGRSMTRPGWREVYASVLAGDLKHKREIDAPANSRKMVSLRATASA